MAVYLPLIDPQGGPDLKDKHEQTSAGAARGALLRRALERWAVRPSNLIRRIIWLAVALAHAPGLMAAWGHWLGGCFDPAELGGCITLSLAMVFFALKIVDVSWLRLRTDRRSLVAMGLILALLHIDVIKPNVPLTNIPEYTTLMATTLLAAGLAREGRRQARVVRRASVSVGSTIPLLRSNDTVWFDVFRPRCWVLACRLYLLRAPPA